LPLAHDLGGDPGKRRAITPGEDESRITFLLRPLTGTFKGVENGLEGAYRREVEHGLHNDTTHLAQSFVLGDGARPTDPDEPIVPIGEL
jgi:hypothetical protein